MKPANPTKVIITPHPPKGGQQTGPDPETPQAETCTVPDTPVGAPAVPPAAPAPEVPAQEPVEPK